MNQRVLIIEDEAPQREVLRLYLEKAGLAVTEAADGPTGWELFQTVKPDLVLLDLMLPGLPGEEICRRIRRQSQVPVFVFTAKISEEHALQVFDLGADDFLRKPVSPREATARVLRRLSQAKPAHRLTSPNWKLSLDLDTLTASSPAGPLDLTPQEFDILLALVRQPGRVFSREQLIQAAWPGGFDGSDRTVDVHIKNLRKKLPTQPDGRGPVETVYGHGYRWSEA